MEETRPLEVCTTRPCLQRYEGEVVDVAGSYVFPRQRAFAVNKLVLQDGTTIVLAPPDNELGDHLASEYDGEQMQIRGRIFCGMIPDEYGIIGRTSDPHLLDLECISRIGGSG